MDVFDEINDDMIVNSFKQVSESGTVPCISTHTYLLTYIQSPDSRQVQTDLKAWH